MITTNRRTAAGTASPSGAGRERHHRCWHSPLRRDLGPGGSRPLRHRPRLAQAVLRARLHVRRQFRRLRGIAQPHLRRAARRVPAARPGAAGVRGVRRIDWRQRAQRHRRPRLAATASTRSTPTVSVKERWTQWDSLCEGSSGPGRIGCASARTTPSTACGSSTKRSARSTSSRTTAASC